MIWFMSFALIAINCELIDKVSQLKMNKNNQSFESLLSAYETVYNNTLHHIPGHHLHVRICVFLPNSAMSQRSGPQTMCASVPPQAAESIWYAPCWRGNAPLPCRPKMPTKRCWRLCKASSSVRHLRENVFGSGRPCALNRIKPTNRCCLNAPLNRSCEYNRAPQQQGSLTLQLFYPSLRDSRRPFLESPPLNI